MRGAEVYLEPWRGVQAPHEQIEIIYSVLRGHGIQVAGGNVLATTGFWTESRFHL